MFDNLKIIKEVTIYLNIAIMATIFSVTSLIFSTYYIYYGFATFVYGVIAHLLDLAFNNIFDHNIFDNEKLEQHDIKRRCILFILQFILIIVWLGVIFFIYK